MPGHPPTGPDDTWTAWLAQFQKLQEEEAVKWVGHQFDEDGWHDEEECRTCLQSKAVINACRCGDCCRRLLIEVDLEDAEREPRIKERGWPIYRPAELTKSGQPELEGFLLNRDNTDGGDYSCVFLDQATNLCTIHQTRPLVCRQFDCDSEDRERLIQLGILPARQSEENPTDQG